MSTLNFYQIFLSDIFYQIFLSAIPQKYRDRVYGGFRFYPLASLKDLPCMGVCPGAA